MWYLRVPCHADDTRILLGLKDEEDTPMIQNYLHMLYKWAGTNNIKLNADKFELLWYAKEQKIKSATNHKSYDDWKSLKVDYCQFFNATQSNLITECTQDHFLKDCASQHFGPNFKLSGLL